MTPCRNLSRHDPELGKWGDCHRCCVAAILDLDPAAVPHFAQIEHETGRSWIELLREWLAELGFAYFVTVYTGDVTFETLLEITAGNAPGVPLILGGAAAVSPSVGHSVVIQDGAVVMDPSNSGICGPLPETGLWYVEAITVGPNWAEDRARLAA